MKKWIRLLLVSLKERETPIFIGVFIVLVFFRIWLITGIPKLLIYGPHDDLFFAKAAHYIIHSQWMGPYHQMTLIKGPFYPIFMVISFFTGLPLYLNETFFYVGACIVLFYAFVPLIENRWWRLLLFTLLLFTPSSLATAITIRVYRDFVYFSTTLYVVAFSIGLFLRKDKKLSTLFFWSVGLGISMGAFMITREEGVWIYPVLFLLLLVCLLILWLGSADQKLARSLILILPILIWHIPSLVVSYLNYSHYGFWGVTEQLDPDINRVFSTLDRIETDTPWHPAIQIPQAARMAAYKASPILNEMKDSIEGAVVSWNIHDDQSMASKPEWYLSQYGNGGSEIGEGHFTWLFRDVVASRGHYANGKFPHDFYRQLADQLETACNDGSLKCSSPKRIPLIGAVDQRHYPIILRMFYDGVFHIIKYDYVGMATLDVNTWPSWPPGYGGAEYFEEFAYNSLNNPGIHPDDDAHYMVDGKIDIRLRILQNKQKIMMGILIVYKMLTPSVFFASLIAWVVLAVMSALNKKRRESQGIFLTVASLALGLFFSRLMTLEVVDATTSVGGVFYYGASNHIFICIFLFLMIYWAFKITHKDIVTSKPDLSQEDTNRRKTVFDRMTPYALNCKKYVESYIDLNTLGIVGIFIVIFFFISPVSPNVFTFDSFEANPCCADPDSNYFYSIFHLMSRGEKLYSEVFEIKDPVFFYTNAIAYSVLGQKGPVILELLLSIVMIVSLGIIASRLKIHSIGMITLIILFVYFGLAPPGYALLHTYQQPISIFLLIISLTFFRRTPFNGILCGILFSLMVFSKLLSVLLLPSILFGVALFDQPSEYFSFKKIIRNISFFGIGSIVAVLTLFLFMAFRGEFVGFILMNKIQYIYSQDKGIMLGLPEFTVVQFLANNYGWIFMSFIFLETLGSLLVSIKLFCKALRIENRNDIPEPDNKLMNVSFFAVLTIIGVLGITHFTHMWIHHLQPLSIAVSMGILPVLLFPQMREGQRDIQMKILLAIIILLMILPPFKTIKALTGTYAPKISRAFNNQPYFPPNNEINSMFNALANSKGRNLNYVVLQHNYPGYISTTLPDYMHFSCTLLAQYPILYPFYDDFVTCLNGRDIDVIFKFSSGYIFDMPELETGISHALENFKMIIQYGGYDIYIRNIDN